MKRIPYYAFTILLATLLIAVMPTENEAYIYEDTVRLHILASSDSRDDQELKLRIRDRILEKYGSQLKNAESVSDAEKKIRSLLPIIEADAEKWVKELGFNYPVEASLSEEWYETREYEDFSLPAGRYRSLIIRIGSGKGKNWWCVMYPPMCLDIATEDARTDDEFIDYTKEEIKLISGDYNVKFKILEDLSRLFSKNG